jgi:ABC-type sugar transport system permease subunit
MTKAKLWTLQHRLAPYMFISPFVLLFACFMIYPLGRSIMLSFYQTAGPNLRKFVGMANYAFLIQDLYFWSAVANTIALASVFLLIQIPASLGLAVLLNSAAVRAKSFFRFAFLATHLVGQVFVAVLFAQMLHPRTGLLNRVIGLFTRSMPEIPWLTHPMLARCAILMAWLWLSIGFGMIYFLAALQAVDRELYEAADVDGANGWSKFWHITVPGIKPVLIFMILVGTIGGLQLFELPYVLFPTNAGPNRAGLTIVMHLFTQGFGTGDLGYASAIGWVLTLFILMVSLIQLRLLRGTRS